MEALNKNNRHIKSRGKEEDLTKTWLVQFSRIDGLRPFAYVGGFDKYSGFVDTSLKEQEKEL